MAIQSKTRVLPAHSTVREVLSFTLWLDGPLRPWGRGLADWGDLALSLGAATGPLLYRIANQPDWQETEDGEGILRLLQRLAYPAGRFGPWRLELYRPGSSDPLRRQSAEEGVWDGVYLDMVERPAFAGIPRLSHVRVWLPPEVPAHALTRLGETAAQAASLWWGSAAPTLSHVGGSRIDAHRRMAAKLKRYWALQLEDVETLQWDGVQGLPAMPWLTLLGDAFLKSKDVALASLVEQASQASGRGVHWRRVGDTLLVAAGPTPLRGDIHGQEDLAPYRAASTLLEDLLLKEHTPLVGPLASADVLTPWLLRWSDPAQWLDCQISDG